MPNMRDIAMNILQNNSGNFQNLQNSQFAMNGINAIRNNDAKAGEQIANNILNSYGLTKEQALNIARQRGLIR